MFQYLRDLVLPDKALLPGTTPRSLYAYDASTDRFEPTPSSSATTVTAKPLTSLRILTWNVDYAAPHPAGRILALIAYLSTFIPIPDILLLQETHPAALGQLLENSWIRLNYAATDTSLPAHSQKYGTVTFLNLELAPAAKCAFRLPFKKSVMGRDALFLDLRIVRPPNAAMHGSLGGILRIGNTHLESLAGWGEQARRVQLQEVMTALRMTGVFAGLVAGDTNAICASDVHLPKECAAADLWLMQADGIESGMDGSGDTWGFQPPCEFPPGRLDKILVARKEGGAGGAIMLVGEGVRVVGKDLRTKDGEWVSDHCGLMADVCLS